MPAYFPENNDALPSDTEVKSLQKINDLLKDGITIGEVEIVPGSQDLPVKQATAANLNATVNLKDGSGNAITSTTFGSTRRLDVNLSSAGAAAAAIPTSSNLVAGSDPGSLLRPLSVDTSGRANVNINGTVPVSGTVSSNLRDGSGTAITSTTVGSTQRLDVTLSSSGTVGGTVPTTANLYGGTDGTNFRAIATDTNGRTARLPASTRTAGTLPTTNSSVTFLNANANRLGFYIGNYEATGGAILYVRFAAAAASSTNFDVAVYPGQSYQQLGPVVYTGEIRAIYSGAIAGTGAKGGELSA